MKNIDLKGIFLGGLLALLGVIPIIPVSTFIKITLFGASDYDAPYTNQELVVLTITCAFWYLWTGFIVSKLSRKGKIVNPLIISLLILLFAFFPVREVPLWYMAVSGFLAPVCCYFGARYHIERLTKLSTQTP